MATSAAHRSPRGSPLRDLRVRHSSVSAMEHARLSSLLVIALLQLSQTEISNTLPESWYAANVINDGSYSPKPLSEIFSTQSTFSSANPIVVLQSSTADPILFSTPTSSAPSIGRPNDRITEISVVPLQTEEPAQPQSTESVPSQSPPVTIFADTPTSPPRLPELSQFQQPPAPPSAPPVLSAPQQIQIQTAPQGTPQGTPPAPTSTTIPPVTTTFSSFPPFTSTSSSFVSVTSISSSFAPVTSISSSFAPVTSTSSSFAPVTSTSSFAPVTSTPYSLPPVTSTPFSLPSVTNSTSFAVPPVISTFSPAIPSTSNAPQVPCTNSSKSGSQLPSFRIRLVAPRGSVTKVEINPPITTTTRRPTTTRTRRIRNNYDGCVSGCGGRKVPICASPSGVSPIDPNRLKGFPSVCHMACHNSFRKTLYEKVTDGRCGQLRTRIRPLDSKTKLKKDDLQKATYTVVQGGPSVIEFTPLNS
ncbi:mucin-2-like [Cydia pomonella]|uniref:mucin-2-like n=1 Tax=Cydia pomonella TaxID=82600 RepID=UPI002ADE20AA|nr:mucin-2-like [Cydia pomonella]